MAKNCDNNKKSGIRLAIPFFVAMAVLTAVSFCIPLRPTQSNMEKRNLAQFPQFTWESLASGDYFEDISTWFSDTFPGREGWLRLATSLESLHGYSEISIEGDLPQVETVPVSIEEPELPDLPTLPTGPAQDAAPGETRETEPQETQWGGLKVDQDLDVSLADSAVIVIGDSAFNAVGFSQLYSDYYAETLNAFASKMKEQGIRVISAPCPTAVGIMIEPEYQEMLNCADQNGTISYIHGQMSDDVVTVDTYSALVPHNSEYIYFRTDHHWTARGAYYSYKAICEALDFEPAALEDFREWNQGEFEGSLYWRTKNNRKLRLDELIAYVPQGDIEMKIYTNIYAGYNAELIQDMTDRPINSKYSAFICSDNPMTEIINHSIPDGPTCILVKDSFGNCLAPFLTQNYHRIYVIDYRKFNMSTMGWFIKEHPVDDIIAAPYVIATQAGDGNAMLRNILS